MKYKRFTYLKHNNRLKVCCYDTEYDDGDINIAKYKECIWLSNSEFYYNSFSRNNITKDYQYYYDDNNKIVESYNRINNNTLVYHYDENDDIR